MVLVQKVGNERSWHDPGIGAHLALSLGLCHCFFAAVLVETDIIERHKMPSSEILAECHVNLQGSPCVIS